MILKNLIHAEIVPNFLIPFSAADIDPGVASDPLILQGLVCRALLIDPVRLVSVYELELKPTYRLSRARQNPGLISEESPFLRRAQSLGLEPLAAQSSYPF
jgi:hypothetical protein